MPMELTDCLPAIFKKHKHKTVEQVLKEDPSYLIWLRDAKLTEGKPNFFDQTVLTNINAAMNADKKLRQGRAVWQKGPSGWIEPPAASRSKLEVIPGEREPTKEEVLAAQAQARADAEREELYKDMWGAF
jgi:hypothetical protein